MTPPVERVRAMREAQGLPPTVEDAAQVAKLAGLLAKGDG